MSHSLPPEEGATRRDFIILTAGAMGAVGAASVLWPFVHSMNPSKEVLALASSEVDVSAMQAGQQIKVKWRGKPVFIRYRTPEEIAKAKADDTAADLKEPQKDADRVKAGKEQWLVMVGVCTHLGCVPLGANEAGYAGQFGGWFCPCHGSHYDTSGRIRKGPAPTNLHVPDYAFLSDTKIKIG